MIRRSGFGLVLLALPLIACTKEVPPPGLLHVHCDHSAIAFFATGSAGITEQGRRALRNVFLSDTKGICSPPQPLFLCVTGHADKDGDEAANRRLSRLRAQAVADYLIELGVAREHIAVRGKGSAQPLVPNVPPPGSEPQNRRVEVAWLRYDQLANCK